MNHYTDVDGIGYAYDANGNLTSDGTNTYSYDYENRLIQVVTPTETVTFAYDSFGRRIAKTNSAGTTRYVYDGDQVIAEADPAGTLLRGFIYGPGIDEPVVMEDAGTGAVYTYHFDGLGSVTEMTDTTGGVVEKYEYSVYGEPVIRDAADQIFPDSGIGNPYLFTGRRYDSETGLFYYRARYYAPTLGRFLQKDPLTWLPNDPRIIDSYTFNNRILEAALSFIVREKFGTKPLPLLDDYLRIARDLVLLAAGELNLYTYVLNDPVDSTDPEGLHGAVFLFGRFPFFFRPRFLRGPNPRFVPRAIPRTSPSTSRPGPPTRPPTPEQLGLPRGDLWWQQDPFVPGPKPFNPVRPVVPMLHNQKETWI